MGYSFSFQDVYGYFIVFSRIIPLMVAVPIFSDMHIPQRVRLTFGLALTIIITQVVQKTFPHVAADSPAFLLLIGREVLIGLCLGVVAKIWLMTVQVVATLISMQTSLSNATIFNPTVASQDTVVGTILMLCATTFLVITDLHHFLIQTMVSSYDIFPVSEAVHLEDFSPIIVKLVTQSFSLAVRLSAPFLIMGLVFHLSLGFLNRLMPQLQVFFVAMPAQILAGLALIGLTMAVILQGFTNSFDELIFYGRS